VLSAVANTLDTVTATVSGGLAGDEVAVLTNTITTADGRILAETITMLIVASADAPPDLPATGTKRQLVEMAFEEIGLSGYEFDDTPEEYNRALRRLDALMAEWAGPGNNLSLNYNTPPVLGASTLSDDAGIPDWANNTVAIQLALRLMPAIGKTMSAETRLSMMQGMTTLRAACAQIPDRNLPLGTVRGAGAGTSRLLRPFTTTGGAA
jgi:hypothetical protein